VNFETRIIRTDGSRWPNPLAGAIARSECVGLFFIGLQVYKSLVDHMRDDIEAEAREAILAAFDTITPEMAYRASRDISRRAELCLQNREGHFEQLLH